MSINRRKFIQQTGLAGAAFLAGNMMPAFAAEKERKITVDARAFKGSVR